MSIVIGCTYSDCGEEALIGIEGYWSPAKPLDGSNAAILIELPEDWTIGYVGHDSVIRCPYHSLRALAGS
jgi:hypothetical protein